MNQDHGTAPEGEAMAELRAEAADPRILVYAKKKRLCGWLWVSLFLANSVIGAIASSGPLPSVVSFLCIAWFVVSIPATLTSLLLWVYFMIKRKNAMEAVWKTQIVDGSVPLSAPPPRPARTDSGGGG